MLRTLRNIRKLNNAKIIVISSDSELNNSFSSDLNGYFNKIELVDNAENAFEKITEESYDMAIIDTQINDISFSELCTELTKLAPTLPKIIISHESTNENIVTAVNCSAYTFLSKPLRLEDIRLSIIMCLNQTKRGDKIEFQDGIYFDEYRDKFFKSNGDAIDFTRLEKGLLKLLIDKKDEIVDYDSIKEVVWKGKEMSIYTMRNIVNKIRQKTYYDIIKNHSNKGYTIDNHKNK